MNYTYDTYGNVLTGLDQNLHKTTYQYSATYKNAYLTQVTDPLGGNTQYAYNFTTGDRTSVRMPSGNVTTYGYDPIDRLTSVTYSTGDRRHTVYDDVHLIQTVYDERGNYVESTYDGLGRLTQTQTFANGTAYSTAASNYYWNDKLKTYTDATGNVTTYTYDFLGRMLTLTHPDQTFKQWVYNDAANQVTAYDEKGHPTDYFYDWQGDLVTVTEYVNGQGYNTVYGYDLLGNLVQVADAKNQITNYGYDSLNRLTQITFPDTTYENRIYDKVGNLLSRTTQNSTLIQYGYDWLNRLTNITYPGGTMVTYSYDKDSNRLRMVDNSSTTTYKYDSRERLLSETRTISGQAYTLTYGYDPASNLIQLTYPDGYMLNYTYDALNRITAVGNLATLTYRKNNEISTITYGNGVQTAYSYDQLGRTTRIHTWNTTATLLDLNYAYDANGNPTSVNSGQETYGYDELNRLTSASGPFGTLSYSYDQVGNRLSEVVNGTGTTYTYGPYNKLQSAGTTTYGYDNNGNTITKTQGSNSWSYSYDYENRLKQVNLNGQTVLAAAYDGDGRRTETVAGDTTVYHYLAGSWDPAYVKDLSTGVTTDLVFAGGFRVGKVQAGVNYYYHLDLLGSVRLVTQTPNLQTFTAKYLPYGNLYATSGAENFQYTGKQLDVSTGLCYYGYRYLDSQFGRFMTVNPAQPNYMNPQTLNQYIYALDNPNRYTDPTGADASTDPVLDPSEAYNDLIRAGFSHQQAMGLGGDITLQSELNAAIALREVLLGLARRTPMKLAVPSAPTVAYASVTDTTTGITTIEVTPIPNAPVTQATVTNTEVTTTLSTASTTTSTWGTLINTQIQRSSPATTSTAITFGTSTSGVPKVCTSVDQEMSTGFSEFGLGGIFFETGFGQIMIGMGLRGIAMAGIDYVTGNYESYPCG